MNNTSAQKEQFATNNKYNEKLHLLNNKGKQI